MEVDAPNPHTIKRKAERQRHKERNEIAWRGLSAMSSLVLENQVLKQGRSQGSSTPALEPTEVESSSSEEIAFGSQQAPLKIRCLMPPPPPVRAGGRGGEHGRGRGNYVGAKSRPGGKGRADNVPAGSARGNQGRGSSGSKGRGGRGKDAVAEEDTCMPFESATADTCVHGLKHTHTPL